MNRRLLIVGAALLCVALGAPAQDTQHDGKAVKRIEFIGLIRLTPEAVKAQMSLKEGRPFTAEALNKDIKLLVENKIFLTIPRVSVQPFEDGVTVSILGEENARVLEVAFWGLAELEAEELRPLIKTLRGGLVDQFTLDVDRQALLDYYRSKGFHYVQVAVDQTRPDCGEGLVIIFRITEGPEVEIKCVHFEGNHSFPKSRLLKVMPRTAETGFLKDAPFVIEEVQRDIVQLNGFYRAQGYIDARATLLGWTPSPNFRCVTIRIGIEEGEPYWVRSIRFEGMTRFDPEKFKCKMQTKVGCRYRPGVELAHDIKCLTKMYEDCAYLQVDVRDASTFDIECNQVDVLIRVAEGEVNLVGEIEISGNLETKDNVIRREIELYTGQPLSRERFERAKKGIARLDFWEQTPMGVVTDFADTPTDRYESWRRAYLELRDTKRENVKDILVNVKERDTGSVRFAIGVGSNTGLIGDVTYQKENFDPFDYPECFGDFFDAFTGGGQRLTLSAQPGTEVSRLFASYYNPRVLDTHWSFRQDAFLTYAIRESWREQKKGFATTVARKIGDAVVAGVTLRNEWVKVTDIDDDSPQIVKDFPGENLLASLQLGVRYSCVDDPLDPTEGFNLGATIEHAGLWGDLEFNQVQGTGEWFIPLHEDQDERWHVLRLKGSVSWGMEAGDTSDIPIYERYFAGGASSIRGFAYRGVGPMENGDPTGGKAMWLANIEYGFPVLGTPTPGAPSLRGVVFVDTGSVAEDWSSSEIGDARVAVGFGVRVVVPFLGPRPVAVDFGFPVVSYDGDEEQVLSFSFGSNF
jgi:outer membrane protein insertion porin family